MIALRWLKRGLLFLLLALLIYQLWLFGWVLYWKWFNLDTTSLDTLEELAAYVHSRGVELWLARTRHDVMELLRKHGVYETIGGGNFYDTMAGAVEVFKERQAIALE